MIRDVRFYDVAPDEPDEDDQTPPTFEGPLATDAEYEADIIYNLGDETIAEAVARQQESIQQQAYMTARIVACLVADQRRPGRAVIADGKVADLADLLSEAYEKYHCACDPPHSGEGWCTGHCA